MKQILKIRLKLLLSTTILATIFILYFSGSINASSSLEELANSEIEQLGSGNYNRINSYTTSNISDIKPESVKLANSNQISSVNNNNNNNNEQSSKRLRWNHGSTIEDRKYNFPI